MKTFFLQKKVWLIAGVFFVAASFAYVKTVYGAVLPSMFGGKITSLTFCPVEDTFAITVDGISGGTFVYLPETTDLYAFYQIFRPGAWVLGMSLPGSTCRGFGRHGFFDILSPSGYMTMVGTSL